MRYEEQVMLIIKNLVVLTGAPLVRAGVTDSAVQIFVLVPIHAFAGPVPGLILNSEFTHHIFRGHFSVLEADSATQILEVEPQLTLAPIRANAKAYELSEGAKKSLAPLWGLPASS